MSYTVIQHYSHVIYNITPESDLNEHKAMLNGRDRPINRQAD